jgi:AAA15 family ATPase/GTPase
LDNKVVFEALYEKTSRTFSYLFVREWVVDRYTFKSQHFNFPEKQAKDIRANASILAAAYSFDVPEALPFYRYFIGLNANLHESGRYYFSHGNLIESAEYYERNAEVREKMVAAICDFDLGISNVDIRKTELVDTNGDKITRYIPYATHEVDDDQFELPFAKESSGTQAAFVMLAQVLPILTFGGIAIIDEIDNDLHPHMLPKILDWFRFEHTNPHSAQIIFTCHTPEVLNLLMKHQVYLVEKTNQNSEAWRLDDVKGLRADDNLYAKYMAGALSAVPNL